MTDGPKGTFACPICGKETPHHHTEGEKRLKAEHQKALEASAADPNDRWLNGKMCGLASAMSALGWTSHG